MSEVIPTEVQKLEIQREEWKELVDRRQAAQRLAKNIDFRSLILDGFCRDEAARYVQMSCDPALAANERADALGLAQASGHLKRYLSVVTQMGSYAENQMGTLEAELVEARAEEEQGAE
jgi:hypothetical protein